MKLSVIIPVYNEVESIQVILERVQAQNLAEEIIVVDDGSKDGTRDVLGTLDWPQPKAISSSFRMPTSNTILAIIRSYSNPLMKGWQMWFMGHGF